MAEIATNRRNNIVPGNHTMLTLEEYTQRTSDKVHNYDIHVPVIHPS